MQDQGSGGEATVPVEFAFGPAVAGWIDLTVRAGREIDGIRCSNAYDPFPRLAAWATQMALGYPACVEVDEEGRSTEIWLTREPGERKARLRVFEPGPHGEVDAMRVDAVVDALQVARAFHDAFSAYRETYDAGEWDVMGAGRTPGDDPLRAVDLRHLGRRLQAEAVPA